MKTYTYKIIRTQNEIDSAKLNQFGRRGWELCSVIINEWGYLYHFKKENE